MAQILKFFISWNKNINNDNKDLLDLNTIKQLNNILFPDSSIGSFIPLSNYINSENIYIIDDLLKNDFINEEDSYNEDNDMIMNLMKIKIMMIIMRMMEK